MKIVLNEVLYFLIPLALGILVFNKLIDYTTMRTDYNTLSFSVFMRYHWFHLFLVSSVVVNWYGTIAAFKFIRGFSDGTIRIVNRNTTLID